MDAATTLEAERERARSLVADLRDELAGIIAGQEAEPPDDEHDIEGSSIGFERARVTALLKMAESRLTDLERARTGTAPDTCEQCGQPIGAERVAAVPGTTRCVTCAAGPPTTTARGRLPRR